MECVERFEYLGTLSGHFDPESRELEGDVHDYSASWKELEGCEDSETVSIDGDAKTWWAKYDPTTGKLHGSVTFMTEEEEMEWAFQGIAQSGEPASSAD